MMGTHKCILILAAVFVIVLGVVLLKAAFREHHKEDSPHQVGGEELRQEDPQAPAMTRPPNMTYWPTSALDSDTGDNSEGELSLVRTVFLRRDAGEVARNNAANKLRECGDPHLVSDLTEMLWDKKETPKWRNYCVQHLFACYEKEPDPAILDTLFKATGANEKMVRICAVWSLARVATPRGKERMPDEETLEQIRALALKALREKDAHFLITTAGIQSCARLGLEEALPDIRVLAASDDTKPTHLRVVSIAALGELGDAESAPLLEKLTKEATGQIQSAAQLALKRIREAQEKEEAEAKPEDRF